jgi:diadenylate cyclase
VSDGVAVVVSEETGIMSVAHNGRMIRRLDPQRLQNVLLAFTRDAPRLAVWPWPLSRRKSPAAAARSPEADYPKEGERRSE